MLTNRRLIVFIIFVSLLSFIKTVAIASVPHYPNTMPESQIRIGMKGYGLTVFKGTTISRFDVTILGILRKVNDGHDLILVRLNGGPITEEKAFLIAGMSGSPIYINGKIIGAFSQGEEFPREPIGMVTPIGDMLENWNTSLPQKTVMAPPSNRIRVVNLPNPIRDGNRKITRIAFNVPISDPLRSSDTTAVFHPATNYVITSLSSPRARKMLQKALNPYHLTVLAGGGAAPAHFKGAPLVPGAAFSTMLATGDIFAGATGTVTYRVGKRILGFGHPFLDIGPIHAPITSSYIYGIFPSYVISHKIASPGPVVGAMDQDRNFAVSGIVGAAPKMVPVECMVEDHTTGQTKIFHSEVLSNRLLTPTLVSMVADESVTEVHSTPGDVMAHIQFKVGTDGEGVIVRNNTAYSFNSIDVSATEELTDLVNMLSNNPFRPIPIKSVYLKVDIFPKRQTAMIDHIFVKEGHYQPGDTIHLEVNLKPYQNKSQIETIPIKLPATLSDGRYLLMVHGGAMPAPITIDGITIQPINPIMPNELPPVSLKQMISRFNKRLKNNDIQAELMLNSTVINVEGVNLHNLPPNIDSLMRSAKTSGVRLQRGEIKVAQATPWVTSGQQFIWINVEKKNLLKGETEPGTMPTISPPISSPPTIVNNDGSGDEGAGSDVTDPATDTLSAPVQSLPPTKPAISTLKVKVETGAKKKSSEPAKSPETTPAKPATTAAPKSVGKVLQIWRQATAKDFDGGDMHGITPTSTGDLCLAERLTRLVTSNENFMWSLVVANNGDLYAGTGTDGRIYRITPDGKLQLFVKLPVISVQSLLLAKNGDLWAGSSPEGEVYRITPDGKAKMVFKAPEGYVMALAQDQQGDILVGLAGGEGEIYKIPPAGAKPSLLCKTSEQHILCLTKGPHGNIYAGTANHGVVYRITPDGKESVVFDSPATSVTALAFDKDGNLYAGCAPKGTVYAIDGDKPPVTVIHNDNAGITAMVSAADGTVYASSGSTVYHIFNPHDVQPLDNPADVNILALAVSSSGRLYAGTGNAAEVYATDPPETTVTGRYTSTVHDAGLPARWGQIQWTAQVDPGDTLNIYTRTGNVAMPDASWSGWDTPQPVAGSYAVTSPVGRYLQYRVDMSAPANKTGLAMKEISISYLPNNRPPTVSINAPNGGAYWSKSQTIRWTASDPDKDTLSYKVFYSSNNGASWTPLLGATTESKPVATTTAATSTPSSQSKSANESALDGIQVPTVAQVTAVLNKHPEIPTELRAKIIEKAKEANAEIAAKKSSAPAPAASSRETSRKWDTKKVPDGTYLLKVVASDRPSNPIGALDATAISQPFIICNAKPIIAAESKDVKVMPDKSVEVKGVVSQTLVPVTGVQYRIDSGEWLSAIPANGLFDAPLESFEIKTEPLAAGSHTLEIIAFNACNNTATKKLNLTVK